MPGRRASEFLVAVPKSKKRGAGQGALEFDEYRDNDLVNRIRNAVDSWRELPEERWDVTPTTARLLRHWRTHAFENQRPFFCQVEAIETLIWLSEVAAKAKANTGIWETIRRSNDEANPGLIRLASKMATGAGKTTVMAMLIAWQALNAQRTPGSTRFSKAILIIAPGITIRDRLRVLLPEAPNAYYRAREIVPADMLGDLAGATVVVTNYHAFQHRDTLDISKVGRAFLKGHDPESIRTLESDAEMLDRALGKLRRFRQVVVINDEAHHCYRERQLSEEEKLDREAAAEAKENNKAARLWISGIEALARETRVSTVFDLSATPFFLRGSGYHEGTLFPWSFPILA